MRPVHEFVDKWGLLDKLYKPDGGDTCHREGLYFSLLGMMGFEKGLKYDRDQSVNFKTEFNAVFRKLHPHPGVLLRHSNTDYDASDWDRMSRDQLQPVIIAFGYWSREHLKKLAWGHLKRGFLFTNNTRQNGATKRNHGEENYSYAWKLPDLTAFEIWGNFIRSFGAWYLWPILCFLDIELFVGAVKWRFWPKSTLAMNQTVSMLQGYHRLKTPLSWLAVYICPIEYMVEKIADHFDDFGGEAADLDMEFFEKMYLDAWLEIQPKEK